MQHEREQTIRHLDEIVETCITDKMKLPFHVAVLCINGSSLVVRYVETATRPERVILTEHMEGERFALPVNVMIVDGRGVIQLARFERRQAPGDEEAPLH